MTTQTQQGAVAGAAVGQPGLANGLIEGDRILVTLTAKKPDGSRIGISKVFDWQGKRIDNAGSPIEGQALNFGANTGTEQEPTFDVEAFRTHLIAGRTAEANAMSSSYQQALVGYKRTGGATWAERIGLAVYANLQSEDGVKSTDGPHLVLRPEQVRAKMPFRSSPTEAGVVLVQLAPTWGF